MIRVGYWYDVGADNERVYGIKLIPSYRWLENQDPNENYYEVLEAQKVLNSDSRKIVSVMTGTSEECILYMHQHYKVKDNFVYLTDRLWSVKEELQEDFWFLKSSVEKKYKEIAYHVKDAIELLERLEDYEDRGLGDIEY